MHLIGNSVPMEIEMGKTLLTIRGVLPKEDYKVQRSTEKADLRNDIKDSKYVNDPSTT